RKALAAEAAVSAAAAEAAAVTGNPTSTPRLAAFAVVSDVRPQFLGLRHNIKACHPGRSEGSLFSTLDLETET
ncbi:MAG: hypothetical protein WA361_04540, partial [Candidatus Acidiferrales bacterium]